MIRNVRAGRVTSLTIALALGAGLVSLATSTAPQGPPLGESLTFAATFDSGTDADFALGDPRLYSAPSRKLLEEAVAGAPEGVELAPQAGRRGGALRINLGARPLLFYRGDRNMHYQPRDWSGTISLWMSLDPDKDLAPGYSDPLLISPRSWDDASLFVDFTRDDVPRQFRFAAFADKPVWNPTGREWDDVPVAERPMITVEKPPFRSGEWTHVAMTFRNFNTGRPDGHVAGYLNGAPAGTLTGRVQTHTWAPDEALIALGIQFIGLIDELALFNRELSAGEVEALYRSAGGLPALVPGR